jgi:hypothetical protein
MGNTTDLQTELFFIDVSPPQSRHVVAHLRDSANIKMAAAVYSGADVVAIVHGSQSEIDATYQVVKKLEAPISEPERFTVDEVTHGASWGSRQVLLRSTCTAFVRCAIRVEEITFAFGTSVLAKIPGVIRVFPNEERNEVVLEVVARDKRALDETVMSTIQGHWPVVKATRTLIAVDSMQWHRDSPMTDARVFIGTAAPDLGWAMRLKEHLMQDVGLDCWLYSAGIPIGESFWPKSVDAAIKRAPLFVFLVSDHESKELQREIGKAEGIATDEHDICCIVLPPKQFDDLDGRLTTKHHLDGSDFFAYSKMLDWIGQRLGPTTEIT